MNFNVNNVSPAFKGIYVIKGTGKEVEEYMEMISSHEKLTESLPKNIVLEDGIYDRECQVISGLYGDEQKCAKLLVTTNEDCPALRSWYGKYRNNSGLDWPIFELRIFNDSRSANSPHIMKQQEERARKECAKIMEQLRAIMAETRPQIAEYEYAQSDDDALLDFIAKTNKEAATMLEQVKEFTKKKIKTFKFKDVMKALKEDRFNIATGRLSARVKL